MSDIKTYRFHLKDGSHKDFEMTEEQRAHFYKSAGGFYRCNGCNGCKFTSTHKDLSVCYNRKGFCTADILSIEELKNDKEDQFQVGDIVEAFGLKGEVVESSIPVFDVTVIFENGKIDGFCKNGKSYEWHKLPDLKLIERPKKKVKRTYHFATWKDSPDIRSSSNLYANKKIAESLIKSPRDFQIHSIEIEEDV